MPDTEFIEFPKWVEGVVCENAAEEKAVLDGTAEIRLVEHRAEYDTYKVFLKEK